MPKGENSSYEGRKTIVVRMDWVAYLNIYVIIIPTNPRNRPTLYQCRFLKRKVSTRRTVAISLKNVYVAIRYFPAPYGISFAAILGSNLAVISVYDAWSD